jgi:N-acetylmuramoyl-L-alanine amidase
VLISTVFLLLACCAALPAGATFAQSDVRLFPQTGYRIADDAFWGYFNRRGGVRTFGYPVSNPFTLMGFKVQVYQRAVLQLQPDGAVAMMNILDAGLLPYTTINGSVFPALDPEVIARQPVVGEPDYHQKALQFVRDNAPDSWQGLDVNFFATFNKAVRMEEAFPTGGGNAGLLLGIDLEVWGLPTSKPVADPTNGNFVYQRFQRGIMHYDAGCKCTQGLLLADYLKSILTLHNLPPDLAAQSQASPLYGQFDPGKPAAVSRPGDLPSSDLTNAFRADDVPLGSVAQAQANGQVPVVRAQTVQPSTMVPTPAPAASPAPPPAASPAPPSSPAAPAAPVARNGKPTVFVDPGHGGKEIGASFRFDDGTTLAEKDLNLHVATRLSDLLRAAGLNVIQSRTTDAQLNTTKDLTGDGKIALADDLQARVDAANAANADILVAVHFNGIDDPTKRGTQTFYSEGRPFSARSQALAQFVQTSMVSQLKSAGYQTLDRGATADTRVLGQDSHYYLLGPASAIVRRPSNMPGIIGEALFVTNPDDANALRQDKVTEAVARGYADAIQAYFQKYPAGS